MRYRAAEKLEIIGLVEQSSLSVRRTLAQLGIPRSTFYAWYERYLARGAGALEDCQPAPRRVWNKLPDTVAGVAWLSCSSHCLPFMDREQVSPRLDLWPNPPHPILNLPATSNPPPPP